ncbi:hypothetical protein [Peptoniphilus asaccharolyticus]
MAYLWGKYERKAEYRAEKQIRKIDISDNLFITVNNNTNVKMYPSGEKYGSRVTQGDMLYVTDVDLDGIASATASSIESEYVARIGRNSTLGGYYKDYYGELYKVENKQVFSHYSQGSYIGEVESISRSTYPDNGEKDGYFYVYKGVKEVKAPGSISYSSSAKAGENLEIRWDYVYSASEYILEKSTGSGFRQVYNGSLNYYSDTLGTDKKVQYRVKAIENGESSSYTTGNWCYVETNQTPTISGWDEDLGNKKAPFKKTFSVDDSDKNQELNVTVRLNGQNIKTIRNATRKETYEIDIDEEKFNNLTLNKRNTIEITVEDKEGASAIRRYYFTKSNTNPTISVQNSNLGEQNKPFSFTFTPDDADGDRITCKIFVGETQIADLGSVTAKRLQTYTFKKLDFAKLPNGEHKIRIEVKDSNGGIGYGFITFSKNVKSCWYKYKKELEGKPNQITVEVMAEVAEGAKMTIKVCNNALDDSPTWEVVEQGTAHKFSNKSKVHEHWAIGVWVAIERQKAVKASYFYGLVGHYS